MTHLMNDRQRQWLREGAGVRIDALEASLQAFAPKDIESLIAVRRQVQCILQEAREIGLTSILSAAERADRAGALDTRSAAAELLSLLRGAVHTAHAHATPSTAELDAVTGLINATAFMRRLDHLESDDQAQVAMASIQVSNFDAIQVRHGEAAAKTLLRHVAGLLSRHLREGDCVAHMRGPEFAIFLPDEDLHGLQAALARLEHAVTRHPFHLLGGQTVSVCINASGAWLGGDARTAPEAGSGAATPGLPRAGVVARNPATGTALAHMLRQAGYEVACSAEPASSGMAPFGRHKLHVALVEVPAGELAAAVAQLRSVPACRRTPVVAIVVDFEAGRVAMAAGANEYLVKPVSHGDLIKPLQRLTHRGDPTVAPGHAPRTSDVLVVSESVSRLIAIGSSLQRQAGYNVRLGRGREDALAQVRLHAPVSALIDLPLDDGGAEALCESLNTRNPSTPVLLIAGDRERAEATAMRRPRMAGVIRRPFQLLSLHQMLRDATGVVPSATADESARLLRDEILRLLRSGVTA